MKVLIFLLCVFLIVSAIATIVFAARNLDRLIVGIIRRANIPVFSVAVGIAMLIVEHPEQWSFDRHRMSHPDIGSIWIANEAYGLRLETAMGDWKPNFIERRIIREAVDWRIARFIRERLQVAIERNMLGR